MRPRPLDNSVRAPVGNAETRAVRIRPPRMGEWGPVVGARSHLRGYPDNVKNI